MIISNIYLLAIVIIITLLLMAYLSLKLLRNASEIPKILFNFKVFFLIKKRQNYFYIYERFKQNIKIREKKYFNFKNYFFLKKKLNNKYFLKKNIVKVIVVFYSLKSKYFDYHLDKKKFNKITDTNSINYLKINTKNKKSIEFETYKKNEKILNTFFIKKNEKKNLVLILILDGLSQYLSNKLPATNSFFSNNRFTNAYTNGVWTFPVFSSLITGQYPSTHLNYKPITYYSDLGFLDNSTYVNSQSTLFEHFKSQNFVTGCYSPYIRLNPTYNFDRGVDFFKFCENQNTTKIIDKIISQIETFSDCSNFIFAHLFDIHLKSPKYTPERADYAYQTENNYNYRTDESLHSTKSFKTKREKFKKNKSHYEREKLLSDIKYCDLRLSHLYNYLNNKKFDNYTIILMGDHGTRGDQDTGLNSNFVNETVNRSYNNIGFFIKDNKYNFKNKKTDLIETIDIFPSLASRYKNNKNNKNLNKQFDGKNKFFSNIKKNYTVSESMYDNDYEMLINSKNHSMFSSFKMKDEIISNHLKKRYIDKKNIEIKSPDQNLKRKFQNIEKQHAKNSNLSFINNLPFINYEK